MKKNKSMKILFEDNEGNVELIEIKDEDLKKRIEKYKNAKSNFQALQESFHPALEIIGQRKICPLCKK